MTPAKLDKATAPRRCRAERDRLIEQYLPLVHHVVGRLSVSLPPGIEREDLYGAGVMGLIHAAETYDARKGAAFKTYAFTIVRGAILDELRRQDPVPRSVRERIRRLDQTGRVLASELGRAPTREELSQRLACSLDALDEDLVAMHTANVLSLDDASEDSNGIGASLAGNDSGQPGDHAEVKESIELLSRAIAELPAQSSQVVVLYFHEGLLLKEIGNVLGVSESRVCQILSKAMARLRLMLKQEAWMSA